MEEKIFCQSCGMPLDKAEVFGTNADGSRNEEYCCYCYQNGGFTDETATMEGMIALNLEFNEQNGYPMGPQEQAKQIMESWFPTLKRWRA